MLAATSEERDHHETACLITKIMKEHWEHKINWNISKLKISHAFYHSL